MPRFTRWWLLSHTDPGHTHPTAVIGFADEGDPDNPGEQWPPADVDAHTYRIPCHQTGCPQLHDVVPVDRRTHDAAVTTAPTWAGSSPLLERLAWSIADELFERGIIAAEDLDGKTASRIVAAVARATGCQDLDALPDVLGEVLASGSSGSVSVSREGSA